MTALSKYGLHWGQWFTQKDFQSDQAKTEKITPVSTQSPSVFTLGSKDKYTLYRCIHSPKTIVYDMTGNVVGEINEAWPSEINPFKSTDKRPKC